MDVYNERMYGGPPKRRKFDLNYPFHTLQELKDSSPSRKHGLSEVDEEKWKRSAVNLIITASVTLQMDHLALVTALEFLHRFYAQYSMVTNDRFLMSVACLHLGGKVADAPKSCRDILAACVEAMCSTRQEASDIRRSPQWEEKAKKAVERAERALLYQLGFIFHWTSAPQCVVEILSNKIEGPGNLLAGRFNNDAKELANFNQTCMHLANQSAKVPLVLQYSASGIAAACIWMGMKLMKVDSSVLRDVHTGMPWYTEFGLKSTDLGIIVQQISGGIVADSKAAEEMASQAVAARVELHHPPRGAHQESAVLDDKLID